MATHNIRLGSMLSFDEDQEKDIINVMEYLNATHSTGKFISNLIRIALDNPEILDTSNGKFEKGAIMKQLDQLGVSYNRNSFFNNLAKEVEVMKKKVDKIYDISMKTYMLAQFGKHIGLEDKSNNNLQAGFVLEKQLKELQDTLGITLGSSSFESNKLDVAHKRADDALEYIIETYDNIVSELRSSIEVQKVNVPLQPIVTYAEQSVVTGAVTNTEASITENNQEQVKSPVTVMEDPVSTEDNAIVDFGDADTVALANFFNSAD